MVKNYKYSTISFEVSLAIKTDTWNDVCLSLMNWSKWVNQFQYHWVCDHIFLVYYYFIFVITQTLVHLPNERNMFIFRLKFIINYCLSNYNLAVCIKCLRLILKGSNETYRSSSP